MGGFGVADYVVFIGLMSVSVMVGVYYVIVERRGASVDEYYLGGRNISPIPLGLSMAVSFISALSLIGFPAEGYMNGMSIGWLSLATVFPSIIACVYFIPLVRSIRVASIFQILEMRFHKFVRRVTSALYVLNSVLYMAVIMYVPGLALNAVSPISLQWSIVLTSVVATLYTTLGGIKAVIWTDSIQSLVMVAGVMSALIKCALLVGGVGRIWEALERGGRLNIMNFNPDPRDGTSIWATLVAQSIALCVVWLNQTNCQRYLACSTVRNARIATIVSVLPNILIVFMAVATGGAMYAYYEGCDPVLAGKVGKADQLVPYLVLDIFGEFPGMAGLFVACVFSGSLSTISSGINSLAAILLEDFVLQLRPNLGQTSQLVVSKFMVVCIGLSVMGLSLLINNIGRTIIEISFILGGICGGPMLGVFTLAMFVPWCSTTGAVVGELSGIILTTWLAIGSLINQSTNHSSSLPTSIAECVTSSNITSHNGTTDASNDETRMSINTFYSISFMYYGLLSFLATLVMGGLTSVLTGPSDPATMDPNLFVPIIDNKMLPASWRRFFRFGVPDIKTGTSPEQEMTDCGNKFISSCSALLVGVVGKCIWVIWVEY